jgi:serine/threonine protein kinase
MWKLFSHAEADRADLDQKPDLRLLEKSALRCQHCHTEQDFSSCPPLSLAKCPACGAINFVPYLIKDYWLYRPLGGGGMGSVYKAFYHQDPHVEFAVKVPPRDKRHDERLVEALLREAAIAKAFGRHPHLNAVADFGRWHDEYFCAMEFCPGRRLDQLIEGSEPISPKFILLWALQVLSAEQRMYDTGYLYRDLKPQNLIVDADGNAHLIDYGLCIEVANQQAGETGTVHGSPLYMPPERIVGVAEDMYSEIYSLGMVMFHALVRKTYYTASGVYELAKKHVSSLRVGSVETRLPISVSPKIARVLDRMVARLPQDRYQTYKEAGLAIRQIYNEL